MLDRLIKKPKLVETIPSALPPEFIPEEDTTLSSEEDVQSLVTGYSQLLDRFEELESIVVNYVSNPIETPIGTITYQSLGAALESADPRYPDLVEAWNDYHYTSGLSIQALVSSTLQQTVWELKSALYFVSIASSGGIFKPMLDEERRRLEKASEEKTAIEEALDEARYKLEKCFAQKILNLLAYGTASDVINSDRLESIRNVVRTLRQAFQLYIVTSGVDYKKFIQESSDRIRDIVTQKVLFEACNVFAQIENQLLSPFITMATQLEDLNSDEFCGALDSVLELLGNEFYKVRSKYLSTLYERRQLLDTTYDSRLSSIQAAGTRVKITRYLELLDKILEVLELVTTYGELDDRVFQWLQHQLSSRTKPEPEKGGGVTMAEPSNKAAMDPGMI